MECNKERAGNDFPISTRWGETMKEAEPTTAATSSLG